MLIYLNLLNKFNLILSHNIISKMIYYYLKLNNKRIKKDI